MIRSQWMGWLLVTVLLAVVVITVLMPLTGEVLAGLAIMAMALFVITL